MLLKYKNIIVAILILTIMFMVMKNIYLAYVKDKGKLAERQKLVEEKESLSVEIKQAEKELKYLKSNIFDGNEFDFKKTIESEAIKAGVVIQSLKPSAQGEGISYKKFGYAMRLTASYKKVTDFVKSLEGTRAVEIRRLDRVGIDQFIITFLVILKK